MPRVHYCFSQHLNEAVPSTKCSGICKKNKKRCSCKRCKCREQVSIARAKSLVESGVAEWIIVRREPIYFKKPCVLCLNDDTLKKSCPNCDKTGEIDILAFSIIRGDDIVMVTCGSGDPDHEVFQSVMSKQTPRVATIEYSHIYRAYVNGNKDEQERIEEYGKLNKSVLDALIVPFQPDPWEGRTVFTFGSDERTPYSFTSDPKTRKNG